MNLSHLLHRSRLDLSEKTAIIWREQRYTYAEVDGLAGKVGAGLASLGVGPGDRVAIYLPNSPEFILSYYGILRLGAVAVCLNPSLKGGEVEAICRDSSPKALITHTDMLFNLPTAPCHIITVGGGSPSFDGLIFSGWGGMGVEDMGRDSPAVILYTSGTTGSAKGVVLTHGNLVSNAHAIARDVGITGEDNFLCFAPLYHIFGQGFILNPCFDVGGTLILHPRFHMEEVLRSARDHKATIFPAVPTVYILLSMLENIDPLKTVNKFCSGGAILPVEVAKRWREYSGRTIFDSYGLSEACGVSYNHHSRYKLGSVGTPFEDIEVVIADESGRPLPPGELGEILIRGPNVMKGYHNRPQETEEAIRGGWLRSGDVGRMDEDGYIYIVDRVKDIIKSGGFTIYPREVEEVIFQHPAVRDVAVVGLPDPIYGESVRACVVLKEGVGAKEEDIISFCKERMAGYKVPRSVVFPDSIPKSGSGKVLKRLLRCSPFC